MRSLLPSYAKAIAGPLIPGGGGGDLPDERAEESDVAIDPEDVASYARVCGFGVHGVLPPTYPHILAFPLAMSYMTRRDFPFPLLGLVHIGNRITQRAPIPLAARPTIRVWAENLRPHRRGRQLDMVTELELDGEIAWLEHSTYLKRGGGEEGTGAPGPREGRDEPDLETSAIWTVPGDIGRRYGDVSGDRNPIHLHSLAARLFGFPGAIAHGMWMKAHCLAAFEGRIPGAHISAVEFRAPLRIPGRARLASGRHDGGWAFRLERPEGEQTHLVGSVHPLG